MRRWHPLNWIQWVTLLLALFTAFTIPILYFRVQHVQQHQNDALHSIICHAEHVVSTQPGIPAKRRRQALHFYETSLTQAHLDPCP